MTTTKTKTNIAPEQQLLDTLDRIKRNPEGFFAIYMNFSKLRPQNKQPQQLKVLVRMFDSIMQTTQSRLFAFSSGDLVVLGKGITFSVADETIFKIREMLQADPLVYDSPEGEFAEVYDVQKDFSNLYKKVEKSLTTTLEKKMAPPVVAKFRTIEPEDLDNILRDLSKLDVIEIIRRQSAVTVGNESHAKIVFQEYFTSIADLKKALAPEINLLSNKWMFQHLTETLDRRMLSILAKTRLLNKPPSLNLNLNISTVFSREFSAFARHALSDGQKLTVEVQLMDIFQNIENYYEAKEMLHSEGHSILIDGLSIISLQFLDINLLNPDFIKIIWSPGIADENQKTSPRELIQTFGSEKVVLARCDSEDGIKWGLGVGIRIFQGYFIDAMVSVMGKASCKYGNRCTLAQCIARRAVLAGNLRKECPNPNSLDEMPNIKSL